ncbi:MAG TPA: hypothetical protein PLM81_10025 [Ginsengibacter sp.]|nr:hypothetical protein [Ginsengibacter sp.]HRP17300.1 hypothetical protein [Ginsengibacter sp.]
MSGKVLHLTLILTLALMHQPTTAQTPRSLPSAYSSSIPVNYVRVWDAVKPESDAANITTAVALRYP